MDPEDPKKHTDPDPQHSYQGTYKFTVVCWVDELSPTWHADAAVSPALVNAGALVLAGVALALVDVRLAARPRKPLKRVQIYHTVLLTELSATLSYAQFASLAAHTL